MGWRAANIDDRELIRKFLIINEWRSVPCSSRFKSAANFPEDYILMINEENRVVTETIMLTPTGVMIPVLKYDTVLNNRSSDDYWYVSRILNNYTPLYMILGLLRDVRILESLIDSSPKKKMDYILMLLKRQELQENEKTYFNNLIIRQAKPEEAKNILPLQEMYELEEVFLDKSKFNRKTCLGNLSRILKEQVTYVAEIDNVFVAKVNTNARGYLTDQIGGVFTLKEKRNQGLGYKVMQKFLRDIFKVKKNAVLFVKPENTPAVKLYKNLGFKKTDRFRISYYIL